MLQVHVAHILRFVTFAPLVDMCHKVANEIDASIYVYGGYLGATQSASDELFQYHTDTNKWEKIQVSGKIPSLYDHSAVVYNRSMFVFGGCSGNQYHNDLYQYQFGNKKDVFFLIS
jgi:N-acetylneuraminic acid mutarotase